MADYPAAITELRTLDNRNGVVYDADKKSVLFAEDINKIIAEIEAIELALGLNPEGGADDVVARLEAIEGRLDDLEAAGYITAASTDTLTNKRITPRIGTVADAATVTPTGDASDQYNITALAQAATIAAPSGTPVNGQKLVIRIKDNGTARALTWNAIYRVIGCTLPTTTVLGKTHYIGCIYNEAATKWDVLAVAAEA
jgi:hypothetical protein